MQPLFGLRPCKLNFYAVRVKEEHDADFGAAADWAQLLKTKLIHRLYRRGQIFHVEIDPVDAQVIDRWWIGRRIVVGALPLPQLDRRSVGSFTETNILAFELDRMIKPVGCGELSGASLRGGL